MKDRKIIAVVGATGAQGSGLVRAILNDPEGGFAARALTRDVNSDKARALAALGAEVVQADVNDELSLRRAFEGAYGAFCVTFFWEHMSPQKETAHAGASPMTSVASVLAAACHVVNQRTRQVSSRSSVDRSASPSSPRARSVANGHA